MKTIKRKKLNRRPSAPGKILKDIFLDGNGITQASFAEDLSKLTNNKIKVSTMKTKLSEVIKEKTGITIPEKKMLLRYDGRPFLGDELKKELKKRFSLK